MKKVLSLGVLVIALSSGATSPVAAQATPQPPFAPPQIDAPRQSPLDRDQVRGRRGAGGANRLSGMPRERIELANRLARMANDGDCPGAIRAAVEAGDREIAQRLYEACRRPEPAN